MRHRSPSCWPAARGHGWWHLQNLRRLSAAGLVRLVGVCDVAPLDPDELSGLGAPEQGPDLGELTARTGAEIAIVCTPIHTHTDLALTAARHGAHVLLEKPPAPSHAEYERLVTGIEATGRACQIGFQSLGSHAITAIRELIADGSIGAVRGIGAMRQLGTRRAVLHPRRLVRPAAPWPGRPSSTASSPTRSPTRLPRRCGSTAATTPRTSAPSNRSCSGPTPSSPTTPPPYGCAPGAARW